MRAVASAFLLVMNVDDPTFANAKKDYQSILKSFEDLEKK